MRLFSSLQNSILTILFLSLIGGMLISGIALDIVLKKQFTDNNFIIFSKYVERSKRYLNNTETKLKTSTVNFTKDKKLLSKISFLSKYADPADYQKLIYDNEKKKLAQKIHDFARVTQFDQVRLYNNKKILISFADNLDRNKKYGFLSYSSNIPEILSFLPNNKPFYNISTKTAYWLDYLTIDNKIGNTIQYLEDINGFNITFSLKLQNIFPDGEVETIGYIQVVKNISHQLLNQNDISEDGFNLLISESGKYLGQNPAQLLSSDLSNSPSLLDDKIEQIDELQLVNQFFITSQKLVLKNNRNLFLVFGINQNVIDGETMQVRIVVVLVFIIVTLLSVSLAFLYFRKYTSQSIKNIINYADNIKSGDYTTKPPKIHEEELKHLADILEIASSTIQDREKELKKSHNILEQRVSIRTQELQLAKEEADKANLAKSQFLSSMSHELRTPLNAILGFAQLIEFHQLNEQVSTNVKEILHAGYHLLDLVTQILDLSKIEAGHLELNIESVSVADIVPECLAQIEHTLTKQNKITITNDVTDDTLFVLADKLRLRQILINLLSNAVKYNRDLGSVIIRSFLHAENRIIISVHDTGKGISSSQLNKIFNPFERLDFKNGNIEGSGIGLTVSKQLVEEMRGEIGVNSIEDEGSEFWFILPQDRATG